MDSEMVERVDGESGRQRENGEPTLHSSRVKWSDCARDRMTADTIRIMITLLTLTHWSTRICISRGMYIITILSHCQHKTPPTLDNIYISEKLNLKSCLLEIGYNILVTTTSRGYWRHSWAEAWRPFTHRRIQEPFVVRDRDGRPPRGPLAVHCFCVCSGSAQLGWEILGLADPGNVIFCLSCRFMLDFFACIYCVSSLSRVSFCAVVIYYMFM